MGVDRTDYLMWGVRVDPDAVDFDKHEKEINGAPGRRFHLIYDGMSGKYAVAGKIVAQSDSYEGFAFTEIRPDQDFDPENTEVAVRADFPDAGEFSLILFSHFS